MRNIFSLKLMTWKLTFYYSALKGSDWFRNPSFWSVFAFFRPATIYQLMIKNLHLRLMTWKRRFFLDTSLVSGGCRNPRKPCRPSDSNYWRDNKDIQSDKNSEENDMKKYVEAPALCILTVILLYVICHH